MTAGAASRVGVAAVQWIGRRAAQEDGIQLLKKHGAALVLSDGMGGYRGGRIASGLVCAAMAKVLDTKAPWDAAGLVRALDAAHAKVQKRAAGELSEMGATALAVAAEDDRLVWVSVGDSPLFLIRDGAVTRLNADHSFTPILDEMVRRGDMREDQAREDPRRGALRSVVAAGPIGLRDVEIRERFLTQNDVVLAASDGILTLDGPAIAQIVAGARTPQDICAALLARIRAEGRPDQDNVTLAAFKPGHARRGWFG